MEHQLLIGKYTLESLTNGLYVTPFDLYREYVQNAADAIDQAEEEGVLRKNEGCIEISINSSLKRISIKDNGTGVKSNDVLSNLIDIGNSQKRLSKSRGFRGIGRLSGLGYCDQLNFKTSAYQENLATVVSYDTKLLKKLLSPQENTRDSINDVLQKVVKIYTIPEKESRHYFEVELIGINEEIHLLDEREVIEYLRQNLPVPYSSDFVWGSLIKQKLNQCGVIIDEYEIELLSNGNCQSIRKPYTNHVLSDRIRRIDDEINDIRFREFWIDGQLSAVLWYADTDFWGTVLSNEIKGIRVRQGNILIGDNNSLRHCFREERFNGWLVGELHIIDERIIPNTRRDDYEKNDTYRKLLNQLNEWAVDISKQIRHRSYERSLSDSQKEFLKADKYLINNEKHKEISTGTELDMYDLDDSDSVASTDLLSKISILMSMGNNVTKYNILNMNPKMTMEQKRTVARVFDILYANYSKTKANGIVQSIIENF